MIELNIFLVIESISFIHVTKAKIQHDKNWKKKKKNLYSNN